MSLSYKVDTFVPKVSGCGAQDTGWDDKRCHQYQEFLNNYSSQGWKLHSIDFREVTMTGCNSNKGSWLVCVFEKSE